MCCKVRAFINFILIIAMNIIVISSIIVNLIHFIDIFHKSLHSFLHSDVTLCTYTFLNFLSENYILSYF